ncbi:MAG TPA: alpha/beta hydrolase [Steroidobacteraceae bacterium]|jgi:pimeloyl-ACP methyl ester carboxylesterase|nr:alpha/beta hydrolase [Steroidobacteraceae bacterium]
MVTTAAALFGAASRHVRASGASNNSASSAASAGSISESGYVPIGGIEQWIQIRGDDRDNPVLLWLNGGPGYSTIPETARYRQWESPFTLVMWDQRGEGKTFERSGTSVAPTMTIKRMTEDGIEVAEYLCRHLRKRKIILLGHSWGSILGIHMIKLRPDLFSAYVGTGQIVELERDAEAAYPLLIERARTLHNTLALKQLEAVGPPPYPDSPKKWVWISWANALDPMPPRQPQTTRPARENAPAYLAEGADFSQGLMWNSIMSDDLPKLGLDFKVPIFFIQGARDDLSVTALGHQYWRSIRAPEKKFIVLPGAGHLAIFRARAAFLRQLVKWVRPVAAR